MAESFIYLEDAKKHLRTNFEKGVECPCCGQNVKEYRRNIHNVMARMLIRLYHLSLTDYVHVKNFMIDSTGSNDYSKLRFWGLIQEMPKDEADTEKRTSGCWKITSKGKSFVEEIIPVQKYVHIYDNMVQRFSGPYVTIRQALTTKFNYEELMKGIDHV